MVEAFLAKLSAAGEDAPLLISLLPGLDDRNWVLERYPETKLINGMISLIAYWAPLEDEPSIQPGWAFYFPRWVQVHSRAPQRVSQQSSGY